MTTIRRTPCVSISPSSTNGSSGWRPRSPTGSAGGWSGTRSGSSGAAAGWTGRRPWSSATSGSTADVVLIATGARPRILTGSEPDGERILTWEQVYELDELPERLIVVGSGVTGAEFASAYDALGADVVLVSSRDRVLPGEDADAAAVLEDVFKRRG